MNKKLILIFATVLVLQSIGLYYVCTYNIKTIVNNIVSQELIYIKKSIQNKEEVVVELDTFENMESIVLSIPESRIKQIDNVWVFENYYNLNKAILVNDEWKVGEAVNTNCADVDYTKLINKVYHLYTKLPFLIQKNAYPNPKLWKWSEESKKYIQYDINDVEIKNQYKLQIIN